MRDWTTCGAPRASWGGRRESNPPGLPHRLLRPARLPVPPPSREPCPGRVRAIAPAATCVNRRRAKRPAASLHLRRPAPGSTSPAMDAVHHDAKTAECLLFTEKAGLLAGAPPDLKLLVERFELGLSPEAPAPATGAGVLSPGGAAGLPLTVQARF